MATMGRIPNGLKNLSRALGIRGAGSGKQEADSVKFVQHMGRWRADSPYVRNASFNFTVTERGSANSLLSASYTRSPVFWEWLVKGAAEWGLQTLKQDHVQVCTSACMSVCVRVYVYECVYGCVYECSVCTSACMSVCV
jgi:hypothetical protein